MKFNRQKVTDILAKLEKSERRGFIKFLESPYYVKAKDKELYLKILEVISNDQIPISQGEEEKKWFNHLFPEKKFVAGKVEKKISQFLDILLEFLGVEEISKQHNLKLGTLKSLRSKGLNKIYEKEVKKVKKKFQQHRHEWIDGYLAKFELDLEECRFLNSDPAIKNQQSYDLVYSALDNLYVNYFIYLGLRNLNYNNFIQPKEIVSRFEKLIFMLGKRKAQKLSIAQQFEEDLFHTLLNAALIDRFEIEKLSKQLEAIKEEFNIESYKNYRTLIRSFTLARYNSGDLSLMSFLFQMYKQDIQNESIFFKNKIPSAAVNNIAVLALRENEIEWLNKFLTTIENKILEPNLNGFTIALNRGKLLFAQRKFQKVLDILIFDVTNFYFKVHARILELMTYYELKVDQLHHKIDAYKIFIYRLPKSKIGKDFIAGHYNFIKILRSICHTNTIYDINRITRLKSKIIDTKILAEKQWLLEKVAALEAKNL